MSTNPWLGKTWQLQDTTGLLAPLMVKTGSGRNRFRLRAGSRTDGRINYYRVTFRKGKMTARWKNLVLVPRGNKPPQQVANPPQPVNNIVSVSTQLIAQIQQTQSVAIERLECDIEIPDSNGNRLFGPLQLYQFPNALGNEALLVMSFTADGGPGGTGGGGSDRR